MKNLIIGVTAFLIGGTLMAQEPKHSYKFEQISGDWKSPNSYRTASGAPGHEYWQNTVDYQIDVQLNEAKNVLSGEETITYINNSPDPLTYLWIQLDQNVRAKDSHTELTQGSAIDKEMTPWTFGKVMEPTFEGGFRIEQVADVKGGKLPFVINKTMMRVDLPQALKKGDRYSFKIKWWYNVNDRMKIGGRSGYEYFEKDGNTVYTIAQFFPRLCVYTDYAGWQNKQFLGQGEFTLPFGRYKVNITVPADHIVGATGKQLNMKDVLSKEHLKKYLEAENSYDNPVIIVTQADAEAAEKNKETKTKTWTFEADSVRDFAFATSRKFIWDAMAVRVGGRRVMAHSLYPKEGNPLWEKYSTRVVAHTLKTYSKFTFNYPYPKAISVHADRIGMEYPMICFNFGRPNPDGTTPDRVKYGMIGVIIHEVGHNFFPMIVNSDERQWTWMDEGLNTFLEFLTEKEFESVFGEPFPATRGVPAKIVPYMKTERALLSPIMTNSEQIHAFGPNAYTKPATALNILRETVMGRELFDKAFMEYSNRWKFKHPTPEDFFRTMEDASSVDLDWFWKGWFYSVDHVDISLAKVRNFRLSKADSLPDVADFKEESVDANTFKTFIAKNQPDADSTLSYYEVTLENVGGLVMPVILEFKYKDGSTELLRIPAEIWRMNDEKVSKVFARAKEIETIVVDPFLETADTDLGNNYWPRKTMPTKFEEFLQKK